MGKIIISPAKSLDFETKAETSLHTTPEFLEDSTKLNKKLKTISRKKLGELMRISPTLASLNYERNQSWENEYDLEEGKQAVYAFTGEVYRGLDMNTLPEDKIPFLQENLRIVSGLYGLLKPLDVVLPYRLEMGTRLKVGRKNNLYEFWGDKLTQTLNEEMEEGEILVNLASNEYNKAILNKSLKADVITPVFKDFKNGQLKTIMTFAKKARGLMVRYIVDHKITSVEDLKGFNYEGYGFSAELSTDSEFVFTR